LIVWIFPISRWLDLFRCLHVVLAVNQLEISFLDFGPHFLCWHFPLPLRHDDNDMPMTIMKLFTQYLSDYPGYICILFGPHASQWGLGKSYIVWL
jgi:hypothetical protein